MRARAGLLLAALSFAHAAASAQADPRGNWRTFDTPHFRVHFTPEVEPLARRAGAAAEVAWSELARTLVPPRGTIDMVVADNVDFANGQASVFPSNRMLIFAHPPITSPALRYAEDWVTMLVTHELTHLFHLDRAAGWWGAAQRVFGRDPLWFPNYYLPAWIIEGLAVYEESRLTSAGRSHGAHHDMIARAAILGGGFPALDELSQGTSRFPQGEMAYVYGALLFEHLGRSVGDSAVGEFIERTSRGPIPFTIERQARGAFGITFQRAWRAVRDSLRRDSAHTEPLRDWREWTRHGWYAWHPRWLNDSTIAYVGTNGRESTGLFRVRPDGRRTRIGERNSLDANALRDDGRWVYTQAEFLSPYVIRSDLFTDGPDGERRLTRGARLTGADVRRDGLIVAAQAVTGATRLVLVSRDGTRITPITPADDSTWWSDPRWSRAGDLIAAVRQRPGPLSEIVVLDTTGRLTAIVGSARALVSSPVFTVNGDTVIFTSDVGGKTDVYAASLADSLAPPRRISSAPTGLYQPEPSPDGTRLAGSLYRADGYHVGVGRPLTDPGVGDTMAASVEPLNLAPPIAAPSRAYRPWRSLLPRYWRPVFELTDDPTLGVTTSGTDVLQRHDYIAEVSRHIERAEWDWIGAWSWRRLGQPVVDVSMSQLWQQVGPVIDRDGNEVGSLRERARFGSVGVRFLRQRVRSAATMGLGVTGDWTVYATDPKPLLARLDPFFSRQQRVFGAFARVTGVYGRSPGLSISLEDGARASLLVRHRRDPDADASWNGAVGSLALYKSLDLPGFAHHVLAARAIAGGYDRNSRSDFSVGGISGDAVELLPGVELGGGSSSFPVRGIPEGTIGGTRAMSASLEYRAPLFAVSRGLRLLPFFFDRSAAVIFADAGSASCPAGTPACGASGRATETIASVGGEILLDAALHYDAPYRFRFGVGKPLRVPAGASTKPAGYVTLGMAF